MSPRRTRPGPTPPRGVDLAVRLVAASLPTGVRRRYLEEWRADAAGAASLGIGAWSIVVGALSVSLTIARTAPAVTGMPILALAQRRARWALSLLLSAAPLGVAWVFTGGLDRLGAETAVPRSPVRAATGALIAIPLGLLVVGSAIAAIGALVALAANRGGRGLLRALSLAALAVVGLAMIAFVPMLGGPAILAATFLALIFGPTPGPPASRRTRTITCIAVIGAAAVIVPLQTLDTLVWSPLAHVPGLSLDEIAREVDAAGQGPLFNPFTIGLGVVVLVAAVAFGIACVSSMTARLTWRSMTALALAGAAFAIALMWYGGFGVGMSIADTFLVSGASATPVQPLLLGAASLCLSCAFLIGTTPGRLAEPATMADPARVSE